MRRLLASLIRYLRSVPALAVFCVVVLVYAVGALTGLLPSLPDLHHSLPFMLGASVAPAVSAADTTSLNTYGANYVEYMSQSKVYDLLWEDSQTLTVIGKNTKVGGLYYDHSVKFGGSQGQSMGGNYGAALGNQTAEQQVTFHAPMTELFVIGTIDNHAIEAARQAGNVEVAFQDTAESALETGLKSAGLVISKYLFNGTPTLGTVSAIQLNPAGFPAGSAQITLRSGLSYRFFEYGMTLDATASDGSAPLGAPDTVRVLAVDASAQILVLSGPINSSTGNTSGAWNAGYWIVGACLIRDGDYNSNGYSQAISTQSGLPAFSPMSFAGFGQWNPSEAYRKSPGLASAQFLNVARQLNGTRLAGQGYDYSGLGVLQAFMRASIMSRNFGPGAEFATTNPDTYEALQAQLQSQVRYTQYKVSGTIMFDDVLILQAGGKPLKVLCDPNVPPFTTFFWSPDDYELVSTGGAPRIFTYRNGDTFLDLQNQNGVQWKTGAYLQLICKNPRNVVQLTTNQ